MGEKTALWELSLGNTSLQLHELFGILGISLFALFAWLCFGYGFCDSEGLGPGYLGVAIPVSFAAMMLTCIISFFDFGLLESLKHSQAVTLLAGVVCSATAAFLPSFSPFQVSDTLRIVFCVINTCALAWCLFICVHTISETKDTLKLCIIPHLVIPLMFVLNGMFFVFDQSWAYILFVAVPFVGTLMLILSARVSLCKKPEAPQQFWFVSPTGALPFVTHGKMDISALSGSRYARIRKLLVLALVSIFLVSFHVAFVRVAVLQDSFGMESHSVGASGSLGLAAILSLIMLSIILTKKNYESMHFYYIVSCLGMCFAALVVLVTNDSNLTLVRVIENVSYMFYIVALSYALILWVATINIYVSNLFSLVGAVISAGTVIGWVSQTVLFSYFGASVFRISIFAATFVVFVYALFGFTAQEFKGFISLGISFQKVEQFAHSQDEKGEIPLVWHDCRDLLAQTLVAEVEAENTPEEARGEKTSTEQVSDNKTTIATCEDTQHESAAYGGVSTQTRLAPRCGMTFKEATTQAAHLAGLSKREEGVLSMLLKGYSDQRIAEELVLSYHTVRSHVRHIYVKMDVHSREEIGDYISRVQTSSLQTPHS